MATADAVVIGAGINGAATAYNLVRRGVKVVLVEKQLIASGGTGRSAAIIRQHNTNEVLVRLVKRSVDIFHAFDEDVGGDPGFVNSGWTFLIPESVSEGFAENLELGRRLGVDVREISREELEEIEPRVDLSDVHRLAYEPRGGYADPRTSTHAYVKRFLELGGELRELTSVTGLIAEGTRVKGVATDGGERRRSLGGPGLPVGGNRPAVGDHQRGGDHLRHHQRGWRAEALLLRHVQGYLLPPRGRQSHPGRTRLSQGVRLR